MEKLAGPLAIGGKLIQGFGGLQAGNAARKAAYAQAREAENVGAAQELRVRENARKAIGQQVAAQFSNGMLGGTGSALDALMESQVNAALDAMQVRRDAAGRAAAMRAEGDNARAEGRWGLAGALLGAANAAVGMKDDWAAARRGVTPMPGRVASPGNYDPNVTAGAGLVDPGPEKRARYPYANW